MPPKTIHPPKPVEELVRAYRERITRQRTEPPPSPEERQRARGERLLARLSRTEASLEKADAKRLHDLLAYARLQAELGDLTAVYGACAEACAMARTRLLGVREAHQIGPITARPPSLPPSVQAEDDEPP